MNFTPEALAAAKAQGIIEGAREALYQIRQGKQTDEYKVLNIIRGRENGKA